MITEQMTNQQILDNYGYNRVNNECISKSIEEDFLYFISDKETILHYVDLYLSDCYGSEYTREVKSHLTVLKISIKGDNINSLMRDLISLVIDTVHADSCGTYKRSILNSVDIYEVVKSYKEDLIKTIKGYF